MIDLLNYVKNESDKQFLRDLLNDLKLSQMPVNLVCGNYSFYVDPCGSGAEVWHLGEMVGKFETIEDLFFKFYIDGKPFIEQLSEIEYE